MNSHLTLLANGKPLTLHSDFSLDIEERNPVFNDDNMFSYPVRLPLYGNRFLLGNVDDPANVNRPVDFEHTPARIQVDNMPFRSGTIITSEDEEIDGALSVNVAAADQSLNDLIGTLNCRDIPLKSKIKIGEKIGKVSASTSYLYTVGVKWVDGKDTNTKDFGVFREDGSVTFTPQALGFSYPAECETTGNFGKAVVAKTIPYANGEEVNIPSITSSFINVKDEYPAMPYCNARVAYTHYGLNEDGTTADGVSKERDRSAPEEHWPYWVLDADRPQSGICFYVLYFLECLFHHLGVSYDQSELMAVEDMTRLCFFTTHCKYTEDDNEGRNLQLPNLEAINEWLSSRGCGGQLEWGRNKTRNIDNFTWDKDGNPESYTVGENNLQSITVDAILEQGTQQISAYVMDMYASSDNFPDESVSTVLDSLWASFGIRFAYDYERKHVRAYFVRNVYRSTEDPIELTGKVISVKKTSEKVTGVKMCYRLETDRKEQRDNIKNGVKDYDTSFDYIDYPQNSTVTTKHYEEIYRLPQQKNASGNNNVYVDKKTGNAYRVKVDGTATKLSEMKPSLFEVGQFKGVEIGDCSEKNEDFVIELVSDFSPMDFNDVNYQEQVSEATGTVNSNVGIAVMNPKKKEPVLAALIDEDMEHEFVEQKIAQPITSNVAEIFVNEVLKLRESYDPTATEDGNSPLQGMDWGLSIALMRGGGSDMTYQEYDSNYDGFGNSKWRSVAGKYALTSDSIDMFGNVYDYNGITEGIGEGERFSLKIRSWKQPSWASEPLIDGDILDENGNIATKIRSRGLFDSFLSEHAHFLLNRRKYRIRLLTNVAQVADIPNHWSRRFRIGDMVGFIDKLNYSISVKEGLGVVEVDFFVI